MARGHNSAGKLIGAVIPPTGGINEGINMANGLRWQMGTVSRFATMSRV